MLEKDPYNKTAKEPGSKLDQGKSPVGRGLLGYFPRACLAVADVSASGANKYSWKGWETVPDGIERYGDAMARHICKSAIEGEIDPDYGHLHAAHLAWNAMAHLELVLRKNEAQQKLLKEKEQQNAICNIQPSPTNHDIKAVSGLQIGEALAKSHDYRERGSIMGAGALHDYQRFSEPGGVRYQQSQPSPSDYSAPVRISEHVKEQYAALQEVTNQWKVKEEINAVHPLKD